MGIIDADLNRPAHPTGAAVEAEPAWRDRLVELHVLAEHGDADAAAVAARWLATDPTAEHVWSRVERTCRELRTGTVGTTGPS